MLPAAVVASPRLSILISLPSANTAGHAAIAALHQLPFFAWPPVIRLWSKYSTHVAPAPLYDAVKALSCQGSAISGQVERAGRRSAYQARSRAMPSRRLSIIALSRRYILCAITLPMLIYHLILAPLFRVSYIKQREASYFISA